MKGKTLVRRLRNWSKDYKCLPYVVEISIDTELEDKVVPWESLKGFNDHSVESL